MRLLTAFSEKNNSGIVIPSPTISIPIRIGLTPGAIASAEADSTVKCDPTRSKTVLVKKSSLFYWSGKPNHKTLKRFAPDRVSETTFVIDNAPMSTLQSS